MDLSSVDKVELHGFGEASERAYGRAVYICAEDKDGNRIFNLVMAKSRVAPVKRISLPRLELLAAYITAKLLDYVIQALRIAVTQYMAAQIVRLQLSRSGDQVLSGKHPLQTEFKIFTNE